MGALRLAALVLILAGSGCSLSASPFAGTVMELSLQGALPTASGQHLEIWARNGNDDIIRIGANYDFTDPLIASSPTVRLEPKGFVIRPAVTMDDPCMIDEAGHLLVSPDAYPSTVTINGVEQSPEEQADQVRARIAQLTTSSSCDGSGGNPLSHCGHEPSTLLAVVPYELLQADGTATLPAPAPTLAYDTPPDQRLAACRQYWQSSPLAYTPNPAQLTAPAHGTVWGFVAYNTTSPPAAYDSIRLDSPERLVGIRELFFTIEKDVVDAIQRGPLYLQATPDAGGNDWVHFDLKPPFGSTVAVAGAAALYVDADQNPSKF